MLTRAQRLMLGVYEQAIADLRSPSLAVRWQARGWFRLADGDYLFSFPMICETFGRDPAEVRARVFARNPEMGDEQKNLRAVRSVIGCTRRRTV